MMRLKSLVVTIALAGCATAAAPPQPLTGRWGGDHVGLSFDAAGGRLDYDCASGFIVGPVVPDAGGRFTAHGTHSPDHGGPERVGEMRPTYPASYSGSVRGDTMLLQVEVPARQFSLGPFRLRRGVEPMLTRCL